MVIEFGDPIEFAIPVADFPNSNHLTAPLVRDARVKVFMLKSAHDQMIEHVNLDKDIECGGVLVGYPFQDGLTQQTFVVIVGVIRDLSENRSVVHFTVTTEAISRTRQILEEKFPGLVAVGWYHSHPGHGVFLSGQDMTIVRGIYNEPWNLAWVIDPLREQEGIFYGKRGEPVIKNKDSHSLAHEEKIWIPLHKDPECIRNLQQGEPVQEATRVHVLADTPEGTKIANREFKFTPRREEILSRHKMPWTLRFFIAIFVFTLITTGFSLFYPSWLSYALVSSDIAAILGFYILMSNYKKKGLTEAEFRSTTIMLLSVFCFVVAGALTNYLKSIKPPDPISPVPEMIVTSTEIPSNSEIPYP